MTPPRTAHLVEAAAARLSQFPNPALDAETLFRGVSGMTRAAFLTRADEPVLREIADRFEAAVVRREGNEPIQYILGLAAFWKDDFVVNRSVLIPRPETEVLVEAVAERLRSVSAPSLLDVGTGSGCIALSLLREREDARAVALDVSEPALAVARENAARLGFRSRVDLRVSNWFDGLRATEAFDVIVSNPPYVARRDEAGLPAEVRDYEPGLALFAEASDDLSSYRHIARGVARHLRPAGFVALETGLGQADRVARLLSDAGLESIEILNDLARIPRVVLGRCP